MRTLLLVVAATLAVSRPVEANPTAILLPDGHLVSVGEGARYAVTPDFRVVPLEGLVSFYRPEERPLDVTVDAPVRVIQGRAVTVLLASMDLLEDVSAVLLSPQGIAVVRATGFELPYVAAAAGPPEIAGEPAWGPQPAPPRARAYGALLAVPSDGVTGAWRVEVAGQAGGRSFAWAGRLEVVSGNYPSARIRLSPSLTALRTRNDARTALEQARLEAAIRSFHVDEPATIEAWAPPLGRAVRSGGYGDRRQYVYSDGSTAATTHRGLDLVAAEGTPVRATSSGRVVLAEELLVTGRTVGVESLPGVVSLFFHLSAIQVHEGDRVEPGQIVGRLGATGLATGAHLHWELRVSGVAVLPEPGAALVDKRSVFRIIAACESHNRQRR